MVGRPTVAADDGADRDVERHVAVKPEVADGARVNAAPRALQLGDDLHRANLGRARDRAAGKRREDRVDGIRSGSEFAGNFGDGVPDGRVLLQRAQLVDTHGAGPADAPEVVALQIDDHQELGPVFFALQKLLGQRGVLRLGEPARTRSLDRSRHQPSTSQLQKKLRRGARDLLLGEVEKRAVWSRRARTQPPVELDRRARQIARETLGQVNLVHVARRDVLAHALHRRLKLRAGEIRARSTGGARLGNRSRARRAGQARLQTGQQCLGIAPTHLARDQVAAAFERVEHDDGFVEAPDHVGLAALGGRGGRCGRHALKCRARLVGEIADSSAEKRKIRIRRRKTIPGQQRAELRPRIAELDEKPPGRVRHFATGAEGAKHQKRRRAGKTIAPAS